MSDLVPDLRQIQRRIPEGGRIRMGKTTAQGWPTATDTWRLTSQNEEALLVLAGMYGGRVKPWHNKKANPPDQYELETETDRLDIRDDGLAFDLDLDRRGGTRHVLDDQPRAVRRDRPRVRIGAVVFEA